MCQKGEEEMWKSFPKWKKMLFLIVTAVVIIRIIYIAGIGKIERQYQTSCEIDVTGAQEVPCQNVVQRFQSDCDRLNSLELIFNGIAEDKLGFFTLAITSENKLIYQTNISLVNVNNLEWKQVFINMPLDSGKEYEISVTAQDCTQVPNLLLVPVESAASEAIESYSEGAALSGQFSLKYGYLSEPLLSDKIMSSLIWLMFLLLFFLFLLKFEQIMEQCKKIWVKLCSMGNKEVICIVLELIFSLIIIGSSGIEFQEPTKVLLYLISIVSAWKSEEKWKYVRNVLNKPWKKAGLYLLYFYGSFALVGQRILIYPLDQKVTVEGMFVLGITTLWMVPVINSVCYCLEWMSRRFVLENGLNFKGGYKNIMVCLHVRSFLTFTCSSEFVCK